MGFLFGKKSEGRTFWVLLGVDLAEPLRFDEASDGEGQTIVGYYQNFGVTAATAKEALDAASSAARVGPTNGTLRLEETSVREVDVKQLDDDIRRRVGSAWKKPGIWYQSGRAFFPLPEPGEDDESAN